METQMSVMSTRWHVITPGYKPADYARSISEDTLSLYFKYLNIENITDLNCIASSLYSTYHLNSEGPIFKLGDVISVDIALFDGYGTRLQTGGDVLRIWMTEKSKKASANGYVIDHGNGSYTGYVRALWTGTPLIKISIANTKEHIGIVLKYIEKYGLFNDIFINFSKGNVSEDTMCSTQPYIYLYNDICNLTTVNYGIPFYCGRPRKHSLNCGDSSTVKGHISSQRLSPKFNELIRSHKHMMLKQSVKVTVKGATDILQPMKIPCHKRRRIETWQEKTPMGFYYKDIWHNRGCTSTLHHSLSSFAACLRGHNILLLGDSNMRSWFNHLVNMLSLIIKTKNYQIGEKWHGPLDAENTKLNVSVMWAPHALPFYGTNHIIEDFKPISWYLDNTLSGHQVLVVIHLYLHLARAPPDIFRAHVKDARNGISRLLKRTPRARIFIKGPHSLTYYKFMLPIDYMRKFQEQIFYEEFEGLHDKVVYLNEWDVTTGIENVNAHPASEVVDDMIHTCLSYMCR